MPVSVGVYVFLFTFLLATELGKVYAMVSKYFGEDDMS